MPGESKRSSVWLDFIKLFVIANLATFSLMMLVYYRADKFPAETMARDIDLMLPVFVVSSALSAMLAFVIAFAKRI